MKLFTELGRYKITLDEAQEHERDRKPEDKIWYEQIPCHGRGFVYLKSDTMCAAYIPSIGILNNLSDDLATARIDHHVERLDGEGLIYFGLNDFKQASKVLKAKKKRQGPSREVRERGLKAMEKYKFTADKGVKTGSKIDEKEKVIGE